MKEIRFSTNISKSGPSLYVNIPLEHHENVKAKIGKQVKVTIEEI